MEERCSSVKQENTKLFVEKNRSKTPSSGRWLCQNHKRRKTFLRHERTCASAWIPRKHNTCDYRTGVGTFVSSFMQVLLGTPCVLQEDRVHFQAVLSCFYFALMLVCSPECIFLDIRCELPLDNNLLVENRRHESVVLLRLPRVFLAIPGGRFSGRR